ncbi:MAG: HAMP domain-containing protein [Bradyrhizobium sp.]|nr:HAMP domain-containing protein [Bradyrhizobium sp.]
MKLLGLASLGRISGQIAALVIASVLALHAIIMASFLLHRPDQPQAGRGPAPLATAARLLGAAPADQRPRLLADLTSAFPSLGVEELPRDFVPSPGEPDVHNLRGLHHVLGTPYRLFSLPDRDAVRRIGVILPDGTMIAANAPSERRSPPFWTSPWMMTLLFAVISVTLLGVWAARALTAPLSSFASAAESFSLNSAATPLPERGPEEIRFLAKALNRMRERITGLIDDRTRMLAAISHDLRTPITRMRLRCEFMEDEKQRGRMLADLDQMRTMLEQVLSFLRDDRRLAPPTLTDVASTLQLVADQFADMGHTASYIGPAHALAMVRPDDLHRGITNLVENAVRFGNEATICLEAAANRIVIDIADNGPGISDADKRQVLEPFVRGDGARNMNNAAGFGLGLSIARAIATAHGGELSLHDRQPHGLIVRVELPGLQQARPAA